MFGVFMVSLFDFYKTEDTLSTKILACGGHETWRTLSSQPQPDEGTIRPQHSGVSLSSIFFFPESTLLNKQHRTVCVKGG